MLQKTRSSKQHLKLQNLSFWLAKLAKPKVSDRGYTLMESLVAIVMVASVIAAITPPLFLSAATRVRNRRAEQAMQLAQAEVDKIRRLVESGRYKAGGDGSETDINNANPTNVFYLPSVGGGNGDIRNNPGLPPREVDIDGDGKQDFLVQSFRNDGFTLPSRVNQPIDFQMGVRVYSIQARGNPLEPTRPASLQFTTANGGMDRRPLAVLFTRITRSDLSGSICSYHAPGGGPSGCP
jgi:prepilin-type N-terminal cleavage/methylation domain-containing protein